MRLMWKLQMRPLLVLGDYACTGEDCSSGIPNRAECDLTYRPCTNR